MDFQSAAPSIVKSVKQRELLNAWLRLYDKNKHPALADYTPDRLAEEKRDLVYYKVFFHENAPRFMIDSEGSRLAQGYGRVNEGNKGAWLDEYVGPKLADFVLPVYIECTMRRLPLYTITKVEDVRGHMVDYERLMLPFFDKGELSDILISGKLISEASRFELDNMFRVRDKMPVPILRAVIDRELSPQSWQPQRKRPGQAASGVTDVVEI
jgi:hypothetical protein